MKSYTVFFLLLFTFSYTASTVNCASFNFNITKKHKRYFCIASLSVLSLGVFGYSYYNNCFSFLTNQQLKHTLRNSENFSSIVKKNKDIFNKYSQYVAATLLHPW